MLQWKDTIWIHKRTGKDIWENLHEPYLIEHTALLDAASLAQHELFKELNIKYDQPEYKGHYKQRLTHQLIESHFFSIICQKNQH